MNTWNAFERVLRHDRRVVVAALLVVIGLSWSYILLGAGMDMTAWEMMRDSGGVEARGASMMQPMPWTFGYAVLMFAMWWIMMIAMMLPSAAPMVLIFSAVNRRQREREAPYVRSSFFTLGYLACWASFSLLAVTVQWGLARASLLSATLASTDAYLSAVILMAAGLWQLTPLKHACLRHCRSPVHYITQHWRQGERGAFRMGVEHGIYCLGCCWFLMALLFYGGVMNLYWIMGLALYVLLEKTVPHGHWLGTIVGIGLVGGGAALIAGFL
ncbi:MAG: DUF2182 domain-containing protein [Pseudomonadales bacterium]